SYDAGAAYPDNTAALDPDGYDLPGRFCADVEVPATGTLYIVGHGLGPGSGTGRISTEVGLTAASPVSDYVLTTTGVPETVQAGEEFSFTLTVVGAPGTSDHIGAHYGASTSTSPSTAVYTKACIHQGDALPGTFTVKCTFTEPGTVYLRGHTRTGTSNETYRHFWAAEEAITVEGESMLFQGSATEVGKPSIVNGTGMLTSTAKSGSNATLCWTIKGTGNVPHVAIHWDDASHADAPDRSFLLYDLGASYPGNGTRAAAWGYNLTGAGTQFCTDLTMPASGDVFVVAHAIDRAAGLGKLSEELKITGTPI
ncbi:MAG TPA: hypothetical protein VI997_02370, partial [Candidatus Thermoplasmatota archaeon]|nr:hypothetical protein [Candidatus Thermoplasmatota archaeon]